MNVENFILNDITNKNCKPRDKRVGTFEVKFAEALAVDDLKLRYVAPSKFKDMTDIEMEMRKYIKREGMKLMISDCGDSEMFVNTASGYSVIVLMEKDVHQNADDRICSLAHEIGHYIDYKHNFDFNSDLFEEFSTDSEEIITETVAWAYAKDMLKVLGYKNWEYFELIAIESLATYVYGHVSIAKELIEKFDKVKERRNKMRELLAN